MEGFIPGYVVSALLLLLTAHTASDENCKLEWEQQACAHMYRQTGDEATLHAVNADTVDGGKAAFDMDDTIPSTWVRRLWPGTRLADPCECRNHEDEATFHADVG